MPESFENSFPQNNKNTERNKKKRVSLQQATSTQMSPAVWERMVQLGQCANSITGPKQKMKLHEENCDSFVWNNACAALLRHRQGNRNSHKENHGNINYTLFSNFGSAVELYNSSVKATVSPHQCLTQESNRVPFARIPASPASIHAVRKLHMIWR